MTTTTTKPRFQITNWPLLLNDWGVYSYRQTPDGFRLGFISREEAKRCAENLNGMAYRTTAFEVRHDVSVSFDLLLWAPPITVAEQFRRQT